MSRKRNKRSAISKEKRYNKRLKGDYKDKYRATRGKNRSIKENKQRVPKITKSKRTSYARIPFPKQFDIYSFHNSKATLKACNDIMLKGRFIVLDFTKIELLSASAGAYLLSTVLKALSQKIVIRCKHPKEMKTRAVLQKIGLYTIIGKDEPLTEEQVDEYPDVARWYVYKSNKFNSEELYERIHEFTTIHIDNSSIEMPDEHRKNIEKNLKELIGNSVEHAYPQKYILDRHFILFAKYDTEKDYLDLLISDSGMSIPITYVKYHGENTILQEYLKKGIKSDTKIIEMAVKKHITGTNEKGRGHGLSKANSMIKKYGGAMLIYSKKGYYLSKNSDRAFHDFKLILPVHGTLVNLALPLESLK